MTWDTVIGLEIHAQLSTKSKLFSDASTLFGANANTSANFIDAGLPGILPVLNHQAVLFAIRFGLAINAQINDLSYFERKNYFYPDLPKGYQISQFRRPIVGNGYIDIENNKRIIIDHAHLEEDAGKLIHNTPPSYTSVDLNRAGNPLLEIVTTPCMHSAEEAISFLKTLHRIVRFLDICDGNMQEGSFRCDVNLSLKKKGTKKLGTRTELKNLNSFRFIEKAINYEEQRHQEILESGENIIQQTRLYCPDSNTTHPMRNKEDENDYRYFIDPDLRPIKISAEDLKNVKDNIPELPNIIRQRLIDKDKLSNEDADFIITSPAHYSFYEDVKNHTKAPHKSILNWLKGVYTACLHENKLSFSTPPVSAENFGALLNKLADNTITQAIAKQIFNNLLSSDMSVDAIIAKENYQSIQDESKLLSIVEKVINEYPEQVIEYQAGKIKLLSFFVGQIMKETKGQASAQDITRLLKKHLAT
jgi:aspartyl-tRNA(Asn)/glutamyl-tRNA(Gln) amidotransferase subunit B